MPQIYHHPSFVKELEKFISKHCDGGASVEQTLNAAENLIIKQLYEKVTVLTPNTFGSAEGFGAYPIFWFKIMILNGRLKRNQNPKCYLYASDNMLGFLCCDSHLQNYKDSNLRKTAQKRLTELLELDIFCE